MISYTSGLQIAVGFGLYWLLEQLGSRDGWRLDAMVWLTIVGIVCYVITLHSRLALLDPQQATMRDEIAALRNALDAARSDLAALRLGVVDDEVEILTLRQQVATILHGQAEAAGQHRTLNSELVTVAVDLVKTKMKLQDHMINTLPVTHEPDPNQTLACDNAARLGKGELLWELQRLGFPQGPTTVNAAIDAGHVNIVEDLLNPTIGSGTCAVDASAIQRAFLHPWPLCKQFLSVLRRRDNPGPLPMTLTADAAASPHPPRQVLGWFMNPENNSTNFECHPRTLLVALATHDAEQVEWLAQSFPHEPLNRPHHMLLAAARGNIPLMAWLRRADTGDGVCEWDATVFHGAADDATRAWLLANGCPRE